MECRKCGNILKPGATFCTKCGAKAGKSSSKIKVAIIICLILIVLLLGFIGFIVVKSISGYKNVTSGGSEVIDSSDDTEDDGNDESDNSDDMNSDGNDEGEITDEKDDSDNYESDVNGEASDDVVSRMEILFSINPSNEANYSRYSDTSWYATYTSNISDFGFSAPEMFFNNVQCFTEGYGETALEGNILEKYIFSAGDGSKQIFSVGERTDSLSNEDYAEYLIEEVEKAYPGYQLLLDPSKTEYTKFVITGYDGSDIYWIMFRIEDDYILTLHIYTPDYIDDDDQNEKGYMTECIYRMCEYADYDKSPRTYAEYLDAQ